MQSPRSGEVGARTTLVSAVGTKPQHTIGGAFSMIKQDSSGGGVGSRSEDPSAPANPCSIYSRKQSAMDRAIAGPSGPSAEFMGREPLRSLAAMSCARLLEHDPDADRAIRADTARSRNPGGAVQNGEQKADADAVVDAAAKVRGADRSAMIDASVMTEVRAEIP